MTKSIVTERINEIFRELNISVSDFAKKLNISRQAVYGLFKGANPSSETVERLANITGYSSDYILGRSVTSSLPSNVSNIYPLEAPIRLPLYGEIAAGQPINTNQSPTDEWVFEDPLYGDGNHFVLKVVGNSMEPDIPNGALAVIRHQNYADKGQIVAVVIDGECATLKRYIPQDNGTVLFQANNPNAQSYVVTQEQCELGEVRIIGILRETKRRYY
ncbi:MAG: helix-turn-helix domain-containing protein [Clostridia bacterium]|jgi:repressor LexA|nr:helix-turn-helix domain-containing protein [Clostridia bacterium]